MSNQLLNIKRFEASDVKQVVSIIHTTVTVCYPEFYSSQVVNFFLDYHSEEVLLRRSEKGEVYSVFYQGKIIGTGFLVDNEVGGVYILPGYQNKGVGSKVILFLLERAKSIGLRKVWLDATPNSKKLYQKLGFILVEEKMMYVDEIYPLPYYYMEFSL